MTESLWEDEPTAKPASKAKRVRPAVAAKSTIEFDTFVEPVYAAPVFTKREAPVDLSLNQAIRNLEKILHPEEIAAHQHILHPSSSADVLSHVTEWRKRNGMA